MKRGMFLLVGGIVLLTSIFLLTYYSFSFFNKRQPKKIDVNTLEIVLSDQGNVNLVDESPKGNNETDKILPYKFKISNKNDVNVKYQLLIEDFVSDSSTELLNRAFLSYELTLDGVLIKKDKLSNISNNINDEGILNSKEEKNYELRIWVTDGIDPSNWVGKSYNYNVKVNPVID